LKRGAAGEAAGGNVELKCWWFPIRDGRGKNIVEGASLGFRVRIWCSGVSGWGPYGCCVFVWFALMGVYRGWRRYMGAGGVEVVISRPRWDRVGCDRGGWERQRPDLQAAVS
jgi:hypothetical protein